MRSDLLSLQVTVDAVALPTQAALMLVSSAHQFLGRPALIDRRQIGSTSNIYTEMLRRNIALEQRNSAASSCTAGQPAGDEATAMSGIGDRAIAEREHAHQVETDEKQAVDQHRLVEVPKTATEVQLA